MVLASVVLSLLITTPAVADRAENAEVKQYVGQSGGVRGTGVLPATPIRCDLDTNIGAACFTVHAGATTVQIQVQEQTPLPSHDDPALHVRVYYSAQFFASGSLVGPGIDFYHVCRGNAPLWVPPEADHVVVEVLFQSGFCSELPGNLDKIPTTTGTISATWS